MGLLGDELVCRTAVASDAKAFSDLRIAFMRIVKDGGIPDETKLRQSLEAYFNRSLQSGRISGRLCFCGERPVASAAIRIDKIRSAFAEGPNDRIANPRFEGYLMSVFTAPAFRRRGIARVLLGSLLEESRDRNLQRLRLHSTDDGRVLYEKFGFRNFRGIMVLDLNEACEWPRFTACGIDSPSAEV